MKYKRVIYTGDTKPDVDAEECHSWLQAPFDEEYSKVGSVDMLIVNIAWIRNECIDAVNRRIITPDTQRKVRIIKIMNVLNPEDIPSRFGLGYVHRNGNQVTITECKTEEETLKRLEMFNKIGVYAIRLKSVPERVEIATRLARSIDMKGDFIDGVEASKLKIIPIKGTDEDIVVDTENTEYTYIHSKSRHTMTKGMQTNGMRPPQMGCSLAHLKAYRQFLKSDNELALIFEDDTLLKPGDLITLHRLLFHYPYDTLDYANLSDGVDWYPLFLAFTINSMYFKAQKRPFNRACAYTMNRKAVNAVFDLLYTGRDKTYYLHYAADDILCHLHNIDKISAGAPYYKPFTLASIESTDK